MPDTDMNIAADAARIMTLTVVPRVVDTTTAILDASGEVDVYTGPALREAIAEQVEKGITTLLINLHQVEYMDSTGLGVLIGGVKRLREKEGAMLLIGPSARVQRIFDLTGLNTIFRIYPSEQEALAAR